MLNIISKYINLILHFPYKLQKQQSLLRIKEFKLKEEFECKFYFNNKDMGRIFYKVVVYYNGKDDYVKLTKLPVQMLYMAYYLQEAIGVKKMDNG